LPVPLLNVICTNVPGSPTPLYLDRLRDYVQVAFDQLAKAAGLRKTPRAARPRAKRKAATEAPKAQPDAPPVLV
jgi:hypothetical protein